MSYNIIVHYRKRLNRSTPARLGLYVFYLFSLLPTTIAALDNNAAQQIATLQNELIESEVATARVLDQIQHIKQQISEQNINIKHLNERKLHYAAMLATEQQWLQKQLRAGYRLGPNNRIRLLLNSGEPTHIQRLFVYHQYYNRARINRINGITDKLQMLTQLQQSITQATQTLAALRSEYKKKLQHYTSFRGQRGQLVDRLQHYIKKQQQHLQILQKNEQELQGLLGQLSHKEALPTIKKPSQIPLFASLKGALKWPLKGRLMQRFGDTKKKVNLKWNGVMISAEQGDDIAAIGAGEVVFADWFGSFGLLLIIDHDHGYMSLYGHNQTLLKKNGDRVSAREVIAQAGDTGGRSQPGLYFEIRKNGNPVDPAIWCRL